MHTTLNKIVACNPCARGKEAIFKYVGKEKPDDEPIGFDDILRAVGLLGAIWCLRTLDGHEEDKQTFLEYCASDGHSHEEMEIKFLQLFGGD